MSYQLEASSGTAKRKRGYGGPEYSGPSGSAQSDKAGAKLPSLETTFDMIDKRRREKAYPAVVADDVKAFRDFVADETLKPLIQEASELVEHSPGTFEYLVATHRLKAIAESDELRSILKSQKLRKPERRIVDELRTYVRGCVAALTEEAHRFDNDYPCMIKERMFELKREKLAGGEVDAKLKEARTVAQAFDFHVWTRIPLSPHFVSVLKAIRAVHGDVNPAIKLFIDKLITKGFASKGTVQDLVQLAINEGVWVKLDSPLRVRVGLIQSEFGNVNLGMVPEELDQDYQWRVFRYLSERMRRLYTQHDLLTKYERQKRGELITLAKYTIAVLRSAIAYRIREWRKRGFSDEHLARKVFKDKVAEMQGMEDSEAKDTLRKQLVDIEIDFEFLVRLYSIDSSPLL